MKFVPKTILTGASAGMLSLVMTMVAGISFAAPGDPPPPSPGGPTPPVGLPIDNGIIILVVLAAALGFYKIQRSRNNKKAHI